MPYERIDPDKIPHVGHIHHVHEYAGRTKEIWHEERCIFCGKWFGYDRLKFPKGKPHCGNSACVEFHRRHIIHRQLKDDYASEKVIKMINKQRKEMRKVKVYMR